MKRPKRKSASTSRKRKKTTSRRKLRYVWDGLTYQIYKRGEEGQSVGNADEELKKVEADYEGHRGEVVKLLIENVMVVDLEIPLVMRGKFE